MTRQAAGWIAWQQKRRPAQKITQHSDWHQENAGTPTRATNYQVVYRQKRRRKAGVFVFVWR